MHTTNKKANYKSIIICYRSFLLFLIFLLTGSPGWSTVTNASAVLTNDANGDGMAGINDTITFSCDSTTADTTGQYPYVNLSALGNARFTLPQIAGTYYSNILTVSPGSVDDTSNRSFTFTDNNGNSTVISTIRIDNQRPSSIQGPVITTPANGVFKKNDQLVIDLKLNVDDDDSVIADLSNIGGTTNHIFADSGSGNHKLTWPIPTNREGVAQSIPITATDNAGNPVNWTRTISFDTIDPEIASVIATNQTSGKTYVTAGDTIRVTVTLNKYDNDTVVIRNSALLGVGVTKTLPRVSGSVGTTAVFEDIIYVTATPEVQNTEIRFEAQATDDAGNLTAWINSNGLKLDTLPPKFSRLEIQLIEKKGFFNDGLIGVIGDELRISGDLATISTDVILTVDLSGIGGVSNQIVPFNSTASTSFFLGYTIGNYTSDDSMPRAFTVKANDTADNSETKVTLPITYVDNQAPTISGGQLENISRPGQPVKYGDQIALSVTIANLDGGRAWADLRRIGGPASATLTAYSGSTYRITHVVGIPLAGSVYDESVAFTIVAYDNAGNTVETVASGLIIDNEPPQILVATFTSSPEISATHPYVKIGDRITFKVQLASSTDSIHDGETVKISLTEFGETTPQEMTYSGGYYTLTADVPAGDLNNDYYFNFTATDNAGNDKNGTIKVKIDNRNPDVGPMAINFLTDMSKTGVVNINDRLEFIVPIADPDSGTCTIDLSHVGSTSTSIMNYDATLGRYYLVFDCVEAQLENPSYVFRATVKDKAGNVMNSLSSTLEVDCRLPVIEYASATVQNLAGFPNVINIGDKVTITAKVDLTRLDSGTPLVNLATIGGNGSQQLYDDGAHNDGLAEDGLFAYTHTVISGTTDGETGIGFTVQLTDNAGNRVIKSTETFKIDNTPLAITSATLTQIYDNNGNTIVDLDGVYTTSPKVATDQVRLDVTITGNIGDLGTLTVDLTPLGYGNNATIATCTTTGSGWMASHVYMPVKGLTNNEAIKLLLRLTDVNGNEIVMETSNSVAIDNKPPTIEIYPITFVVDNGRLNEANLGDVIQIKVKLNNHDGILPMIDFENLYIDNGLTAPSPTLFPPNTTGGNEYVYQWTVPEGLASVASLTILAYDYSGNMAYAYTNQIRFLSKLPVFSAYPQTRADLLLPDLYENNIVNPGNVINNGDQVKITCVMTSLYTLKNDPPATVVVDMRSLTNDTSDDSDWRYFDGNSSTYWTPLNYVTGSGSPYVYSATFTAQLGDAGIDTNVASFAVKVLHPDTNAIALASTTVICNPSNPFGIDTELPRVKTTKLVIIDEKGDNLASNTVNIGDLLKVTAEIEKFSDPGSVTAVLETSLGEKIFSTPLIQITGTNLWEAEFTVATGTIEGESLEGGWKIIDTTYPKYKIMVSDDADNMVVTSPTTPVPNFTIDTNPPQITNANIGIINNNPENWVANVGGYTGINGAIQPDAIVASLTIATASDLLGNGMAYIDLSPIDGTSTYRLDTITGALAETGIPFALATETFDLATRTFRIYARDKSGNRSWVAKTLAVDSKRPELASATYDGRTLMLTFSEAIRSETLKNNMGAEVIRIGYKFDHTDWQIPNKSVAPLNENDILYTEGDSKIIGIELSSGTKKIISDWGKRDLYISISQNDSTTGEDNVASLALDISGNWLRPISRNITTFKITITNDYTVRPNLVTGRYNATDDPGYLYIDFDKDVDAYTVSPESLRSLAIWYNRSSANENWLNRYRLNLNATDTFDSSDPENTTQTLRVGLSQEAQDWIALKYTRTGEQFHLQVRGAEYEPNAYPTDKPPLVRDYEGNRVTPILPANSVAAALTPLNSVFTLSPVTLDLASPTPLLTINFDRRARLFTDVHTAGSLTLTKKLPADLSRVYIYAKENMTGGSISLGTTSNITPMVDWAAYKTLNDYASTTVHIPLTAEALKIMLSWGTGDFYIACSDSAFKDLWGNATEKFPSQSNTAEVIYTIKPSNTAPPSIYSVAIMPVRPANTALFKGQTAGSFFYEVSFETATVSADVRIPIDRNMTPTLQLQRIAGDGVIDNATFVGWLDHNQNGTIRTVARFTNQNLPTSGSDQRAPVKVSLDNVFDVFSKELTNKTASFAYDLSKKDNTGIYNDGFNQIASSAMLFDNQAPYPVSAIPTGTVGITAVGDLKVSIKFNEAMDMTDSSSWRPQLRLVQGTSTVMSFNFSQWLASDTAEFTNLAAFDSTTTQGVCKYYISGGYDEAGNNCSDKELEGYTLTIKSKGPIANSYKVQTLQSTTARNSSDFTYDTPFSPAVSGVATITIDFQNNTSSQYWLHIFDQNDNFVASTSVSTNSIAGWNGRDANGNLVIDGTYDMVLVDNAGNESAQRGSITIDSTPLKVNTWLFPNLNVYNGKAYFSPLVTGAAKIDAYSYDINQIVKMRLLRTGVSTDTYQMANSSSIGYTINFDGKNTQIPAGYLSGEYEVSAVDLAGNVGIPLYTTSQATATLIIDRTAPNIAEINTFKFDVGNNLKIEPAVDRFNSRKHSLRIEFAENIAGEEMPLTTDNALVRIMLGSALIRELKAEGATPLYVLWDGKDSSGKLVSDGTYRITICDRAGNIAAMTKDVYVVSSVFELASVTQIDKQSIRLTYTHNLNVTDAETGLLTRYQISPDIPSGISITNPKVDAGNTRIITAELTEALKHNERYTVKTPGIQSEDGDEIATGNSQLFTADAQGPMIANVTYDGLTSQTQFNVVFDEQVDSTTSQDINKYTLSITGASGTIGIVTAVLRADLKSVTLTADREILEGDTYKIVASGVTDLFKNASYDDYEFDGRDVTPPVLTITAFSNPANEFDFSVVIMSNEDIKGQPAAVVTQSGGTAVSMLLNEGSSKRMFIGGAHLDPNYPGIATIKVTAKDMSDNPGTTKLNFATAFVNASVRAAIKSADNVVEAVFEAGTLNKNSLVAILPEELGKISDSSTRASLIMPRALTGLSASQLISLRGNISSSATNNNGADELVPVGNAYTLIVPANRLNRTVKLSMKLDKTQLNKTVGLYQSEGAGWKPVKFSISDGTAIFEAASAGTFAMMRDNKAPRATMLTKISTEAMRESRPAFMWKLEEYASGIDAESAFVVLNGRKQSIMIDSDGTTARFIPDENLPGGNYEISMNISDNAGNQTLTQAIRFALQPPLTIHEVIQFPNPARNRVNLRISTNRPDLDASEIRVRIYDVAGHLVAGTNEMIIRAGTNGATKMVQDITWDLRNNAGKAIANGVYFARIELRDPDNWEKKTKYTHKIAVLR